MGKFSFSFFVKRQSSRRIHGVESCQTREWRKNKDNKTAKRSLYNSQTSERANETKEQCRMFLLYNDVNAGVGKKTEPGNKLA